MTARPLLSFALFLLTCNGCYTVMHTAQVAKGQRMGIVYERQINGADDDERESQMLSGVFGGGVVRESVGVEGGVQVGGSGESEHTDRGISVMPYIKVGFLQDYPVNMAVFLRAWYWAPTTAAAIVSHRSQYATVYGGVQTFIVDDSGTSGAFVGVEMNLPGRPTVELNRLGDATFVGVGFTNFLSSEE